MNIFHRFKRTKTAKALLAFFVFVSLIGLLLFTPGGNRLLSPMIAKALSSGFSTSMSIQKFSLTPKRFHLIAQDGYGNTLSTRGGISLLTLRLYAHYRMECLSPKGMNPIAEPFKTEGALSGGMTSLTVQGNARIFNGTIDYKGELHRFQLTRLTIGLNALEYQSLMQLFEYPSDTDTKLSGTLRLEGIDRRDITGEIQLSALTTRFRHTPIIEGDENSSITLRHLLSDTFGRVKGFTTDITLNASLEHAGILEQFIGIPLGGGLKVQGNLAGNEKQLTLKATSDVADSETKLTVMITDLEPSSVSLDVRHADALKTFSLFALPSPITGKFSGYAEFNTTRGAMYVNIAHGETAPAILKKHYQITQPLIRFNAEVSADLSKNGVRYRAAFTSNLTRIQFDATTRHDQMLRELLITLPTGSVHR